MQTYLIMTDFRQKFNKKGIAYGWHIAELAMPESKWGYGFVTGCYREKPADSWERIAERIRTLFPAAREKQISKTAG